MPRAEGSHADGCREEIQSTACQSGKADVSWREPRESLGAMLRSCTSGHYAIAGLPLALCFDLMRAAKFVGRPIRKTVRALTRSNRPGEDSGAH